MHKVLGKLIPVSFYLIAFLTPLILWPKTSEIFEFNKIVFIYFVTILICTFWIIKMLLTRKIIFTPTGLDIFLLMFLASNVLSTVFSIDQRTSIFGYYSRFNGGLLSTICYLILYWAYVSNMDKSKTKVFLSLLLSSSLFVGAYAVLQHFGIDKNIWADDVVNRVFSTLGQPNWLAAWSVGIMPISWLAFVKTSKKKNSPKYQSFAKYIAWISALILFPTLLFTKSRSGIIAFVAVFIFFWAGLLIKKYFLGKATKLTYKYFYLLSAYYFVIAIIFGTPWSVSLESKLTKPVQDATKRNVTSVLESGSTGSGQIRKIVWRGALTIWRKYPLTGSGVETFAYTYQKYKPVEHNLTAEWDYVYNKAHNEYLNYLATTGVVGFATYIAFIVVSLIQILNLNFFVIRHPGGIVNSEIFKNWKINLNLRLALMTSYISLLITNFFGFSVVPTSTVFFLLPAIAFTLNKKPINTKEVKYSSIRIAAVVLIFLLSIYLTSLTVRYWYTDYLYSQANKQLESGNIERSQKTTAKLLKISSKEPLFASTMSQTYAQTALYLYKNEDTELYKTYIGLAENEAKKAVSLSPNNVFFKRNLASIYLLFASIEPDYLLQAKDALSEAVIEAPTDAKLFYNLGLIYLKLGQLTQAEEVLKYTVLIKENYSEGRYALALTYHNQDKKDETKKQLEYILEKIDPNNSEAKQLLDELK